MLLLLAKLLKRYALYTPRQDSAGSHSSFSLLASAIMRLFHRQLSPVWYRDRFTSIQILGLLQIGRTLVISAHPLIHLNIVGSRANFSIANYWSCREAPTHSQIHKYPSSKPDQWTSDPSHCSVLTPQRSIGFNRWGGNFIEIWIDSDNSIFKI